MPQILMCVAKYILYIALSDKRIHLSTRKVQEGSEVLPANWGNPTRAAPQDLIYSPRDQSLRVETRRAYIVLSTVPFKRVGGRLDLTDTFKCPDTQ